MNAQELGVRALVAPGPSLRLRSLFAHPLDLKGVQEPDTKAVSERYASRCLHVVEAAHCGADGVGAPLQVELVQHLQRGKGGSSERCPGRPGRDVRGGAPEAGRQWLGGASAREIKGEAGNAHGGIAHRVESIRQSDAHLLDAVAQGVGPRLRKASGEEAVQRVLGAADALGRLGSSGMLPLA